LFQQTVMGQFRQVTDGFRQVQSCPAHPNRAPAQVSQQIFQMTTPMAQVKPTG